jgi:holo-[acyl-carrier protein] synthase
VIAGIGVDLCDVARIARAIEGRDGAAFLRRVFTTGERAYCDRRRGAPRVQSYAARFAAKEAVMKALGTGWGQGVSWQDVEVVREGDGAPHLVLHGVAADRIPPGGRWHLTLSHTDTTAIAWVLLEAPSATSTTLGTRMKRAAAERSTRRPPTRRR